MSVACHIKLFIKRTCIISKIMYISYIFTPKIQAKYQRQEGVLKKICNLIHQRMRRKSVDLMGKLMITFYGEQFLDENVIRIIIQ